MTLPYLNQAAATIRALAEDPDFPALFGKMAEMLCLSLKNGNKILFAGNGGSAADCQHLAGELVVRFRADRPALPGLALTVDTSVLTACLNDFGPEPIFKRQVEAFGKPGDVLWALSTSGNSRNIILACEAARAGGLKVLGFTGNSRGALRECSDLCFEAPSSVTSHVQECHITVGHMLCLAIEENLFGNK